MTNYQKKYLKYKKKYLQLKQLGGSFEGLSAKQVNKIEGGSGEFESPEAESLYIAHNKLKDLKQEHYSKEQEALAHENLISDKKEQDKYFDAIEFLSELIKPTEVRFQKYPGSGTTNTDTIENRGFGMNEIYYYGDYWADNANTEIHEKLKEEFNDMRNGKEGASKIWADLKFDALKKKIKQLVDNKNDHPKMENLIQYIENNLHFFNKIVEKQKIEFYLQQAQKEYDQAKKEYERTK